METNNPGNPNSLFNLSLDQQVKSKLQESARWGGIFAWLSLISITLGLLSGIFLLNKVEGSVRSVNIITIIITFFIFVVLFYYLRKFSHHTSKGLSSNDIDRINVGLSGLSTYFKIIGILFILVLVLFFLSFLTLLFQ
ncbi:MAG: DUF5362 family protein [Chitinophagaceae bacterium]|nr:DUF5362 family protein [Chitinophagaceae bacterium]